MLILTRRIGESVIINENIRVINLGIRGRQVRFGINAPKDILVNREEIHKRTQVESDDLQEEEGA